MLEFLAQWGVDIFLGLAAAGITAYFTAKSKQWKAEIANYKSLLEEKRNEQAELMIDEKLEPIYDELEALRKYIREAESIEKTHMSLILASYRFRLIQLCKEFIKQGYITPAQYEQINEFYTIYTGLGGNGQAENFFNKVMQLPIQ